MLEKISIKIFYAIGLIFVFLISAGIFFENYYITLLPAALVFIWLLINQTKAMLFFMVFCVPLSIQVNNLGAGLGLAFPTEPVFIIVFLGLIAKIIDGSAFDKSILKNSLSLLIFVSIFWDIVSTFSSTMPLVSFKFVLSRIWYLVVIYLLFSQFFKEKKYIIKFIWLLAAGICIVALYTIYNHSKGGFTRGFAYAAMQPLLPDHGMYAALVSFIIPPLIVIGVWGYYFNQNVFMRLISFIMAAFLILAVILSYTRAAWLSIIGAVAISVFILMGFRFRTFLLGLVLASSVYFYIKTDIQTELSRNKQGSADDIEQHVSSITNVSTDPSNLERLNRWNCAYRMYKERPIVGWGPGTYVFQYAPFQLSSELTIISTNAGDLGNVHSEYLRSLAETGLPGFLLWISIVLYCFYLGFKIYAKSESKDIKFLSLAIISGLATYFIHSVVNNYSEFDKLAVPMWGFMAALVSLNSFHLKNDLEKI
ncbi:MAG: O-antigen ligase family protein [Bacteroidetes bacterium]|nr:O-antigen ligase family protein [Bacteroidota bacterium]